MSKKVTIAGKPVRLAPKTNVHEKQFIGREVELLLCKAAWGVDENNELSSDQEPLHFRLQGPPGMGKNELVYELARQLGLDLYILPGHEELTPEDLSLLIVPVTEETAPTIDNSTAENAELCDDDDDAPYEYATYDTQRPSGQRFELQASPLATAIFEGGLCFFDEINRVPDRALSPLSSVLDDRKSIYSAITGTNIEAKNYDAARRFRFCCALNPALSQTGQVLPDYIAQRTLPAIEIARPPFEDIIAILQHTLEPSTEFLQAFEKWYQDYQESEISVRQAIALMTYAMNYQSHSDESAFNIIEFVKSFIVRKH